jgi:uncharacterized protein (TIGR02391 family)
VAVRRTQPDSIPPTLSPHQAIPLLQRQIERLEQQIIHLAYNHPDVEGWVSTTTDILNQAFGQPNWQMHSKTSDFVHADSGLPSRMVPYGGRVNPQAVQQRYVMKQEKRKALLKAYVEQLQDLAPPSAVTAPDQYVFHSEIERVSGQLYRDGHYKQAALEAYIRVIEQVRMVSGISDDGDSLMNRAFGSEKQTPVIQFNSLSTDAERDEQRGFMFLFKGIVGLRNSKAHSNRLFDDPRRAHEYLALASLLMRLLEIAQDNKPSHG